MGFGVQKDQQIYQMVPPKTATTLSKKRIDSVKWLCLALAVPLGYNTARLIHFRGNVQYSCGFTDHYEQTTIPRADGRLPEGGMRVFDVSRKKMIAIVDAHTGEKSSYWKKSVFWEKLAGKTICGSNLSADMAPKSTSICSLPFPLPFHGIIRNGSQGALHGSILQIWWLEYPLRLEKLVMARSQ